MDQNFEGTLCPCCGLSTLTHGYHSGTNWFRGQVYHYRWEGWYCNTCGDGIVKYCEEEEAKWQEFLEKVRNDHN